MAFVDDAPDLEFDEMVDARTEKELARKGDKEIVMKEYWWEFFRKQKVVLKDIVDKRQVGLYGRSFKKLNVVNGKPTMEIIDPQHILIE